MFGTVRDGHFRQLRVDREPQITVPAASADSFVIGDMAKNQEPIKVKAFVTIDGKEVDMDTLSPEVRNRIGAELKVAC